MMVISPELCTHIIKLMVDTLLLAMAHVIIVENLVQFLLNILLHLIFNAAALFLKIRRRGRLNVIGKILIYVI